MKKYKVMTQKDKYFSGEFDPEKLESALNKYAEEGWEVLAITTDTVPSLTTARDEIIVVFVKDV